MLIVIVIVNVIGIVGAVGVDVAAVVVAMSIVVVNCGAICNVEILLVVTVERL